MWTADLIFLGLGLALAARMSHTASSNGGGALGEALFNLSSLVRTVTARYRKA